MSLMFRKQINPHNSKKFLSLGSQCCFLSRCRVNIVNERYRMTAAMNITLSLTNQHIHVFIIWECRSCRYRTGTDQIISLQVKIRQLVLYNEKFWPCFESLCVFCFFLVVFICVLSVEQAPSAKHRLECGLSLCLSSLTITAGTASNLFGMFHLVTFASD